MRVLFVTTDAEIGGAEVLLESLAEHRRAGDEVSLVVLMGRGSLSDRLEVAMDRVDYLGFSGASRNLRAMVSALENVIEQRAPQVVSSHLFHADLVTALADTGTAAKVTTLHTERFGRGVHPLTRVIARAVALMSRRFDAVVATSPGAAAFGKRYRYAHDAVVIPNAVGMPAAPTFTRSSRVLLSLARYHPVKGHDILLEAFARIAPQCREWSLDCAGPGLENESPEIDELIDRVGVRELVDAGRIRFRGPAADIGAVMDAASALVISSRYGETAPIVGLEALARGIPVITTDLGIAATFTERRFVAQPGSVDELAAAMSAYCGLDDDARAALSSEARRRCAEHFSIDRVTAALDEVYRAAITRRARRVRGTPHRSGERS